MHDIATELRHVARTLSTLMADCIVDVSVDGKWIDCPPLSR